MSPVRYTSQLLSALRQETNSSDSLTDSTLLALLAFTNVARDIVSHSVAGGGPTGRKSGLHITLRDLLKAEWFPTYASLISNTGRIKETPRQAQLKEAERREAKKNRKAVYDKAIKDWETQNKRVTTHSLRLKM